MGCENQGCWQWRQPSLRCYGDGEKWPLVFLLSPPILSECEALFPETDLNSVGLSAALPPLSWARSPGAAQFLAQTGLGRPDPGPACPDVPLSWASAAWTPASCWGLWLRWGCPRSREPHFCESCSTQIQVPLGSCSVTLAFAASTFCSSSLCFYSRRTEMRCLVVFSSWREDKISRQRPPVPANQRLGVSLSPPLPISSRSPAGPVGSARQGSTQPPLARSLCRLTPMELCPPQWLSSLQSHFSGLLSGPSFNDLNETLSLLCPNHLVTVHKPRMKCGCLAPPGSFVWLRDSFRAQTPTHPQFPAFTSAAPSWKLAFSCFSRGVYLLSACPGQLSLPRALHPPHSQSFLWPALAGPPCPPALLGYQKHLSCKLQNHSPE